MSKKNWPWMTGRNKKSEILDIPLEKIHPNPFQPRREFDEHELWQLSQSIRVYGLIQPIVLRKIGDTYKIVAGERRYRACCLLGKKTIPAMVQEMDDEKAAAISLIENIQRKELNYFEEAQAYNILINSFGMTQDELARKIGRSQSSIANKLRILRLPEAVRQLIEPTIITERHARALLRINSTQIQMEVVRQIYEKELTVKETEQLVEKLSCDNLPGENKAGDNQQNVSMIIRDARIFLNTIRETIKRARQTGVDIIMEERELENEYEISIKIAKNKRNLRRLSNIN
jgi:ParB family chromosome partitioning protein